VQKTHQIGHPWRLLSPPVFYFINDVNLFTLQYFINYNMDDGWYLITAPINTANWKADSDNRWTVPLGGGVGWSL
jgi:hypothetical protein